MKINVSPDTSIIMSNCEDGDVRLVDGSTQYEGRVEVCINKVWGTVCSSRRYSWSTNYYWGTPDSKVVCRQLGYLELGTIVIFLLLFIILYIYIYIYNNRLSYLYNCYSVWTRNKSNTDVCSKMFWSRI